jgi:hypothetical protein
MSNLKDRIKEILETYKNANLGSEIARDEIANELCNKLGVEETRRYGWDDE